jgi:hypothetical protein
MENSIQIETENVHPLESVDFVLSTAKDIQYGSNGFMFNVEAKTALQIKALWSGCNRDGEYKINVYTCKGPWQQSKKASQSWMRIGGSFFTEEKKLVEVPLYRGGVAMEPGQVQGFYLHSPNFGCGVGCSINTKLEKCATRVRTVKALGCTTARPDPMVPTEPAMYASSGSYDSPRKRRVAKMNTPAKADPSREVTASDQHLNVLVGTCTCSQAPFADTHEDFHDLNRAFAGKIEYTLEVSPAWDQKVARGMQPSNCPFWNKANIVAWLYLKGVYQLENSLVDNGIVTGNDLLALEFDDVRLLAADFPGMERPFAAALAQLGDPDWSDVNLDKHWPYPMVLKWLEHCSLLKYVIEAEVTLNDAMLSSMSEEDCCQVLSPEVGERAAAVDGATINKSLTNAVRHWQQQVSCAHHEMGNTAGGKDGQKRNWQSTKRWSIAEVSGAGGNMGRVAAKRAVQSRSSFDQTTGFDLDSSGAAAAAAAATHAGRREKLYRSSREDFDAQLSSPWWHQMQQGEMPRAVFDFSVESLVAASSAAPHPLDWNIPQVCEWAELYLDSDDRALCTSLKQWFWKYAVHGSYLLHVSEAEIAAIEGVDNEFHRRSIRLAIDHLRDISSGAPEVKIGGQIGGSIQYKCMGIYQRQGGIFSNRPVYVKISGDEALYLYYLNDFGTWSVGASIGSTETFLYCISSALIPEHIEPEGVWIAADATWTEVPVVKLIGVIKEERFNPRASDISNWSVRTVAEKLDELVGGEMADFVRRNAVHGRMALTLTTEEIRHDFHSHMGHSAAGSRRQTFATSTDIEMLAKAMMLAMDQIFIERHVPHISRQEMGVWGWTHHQVGEWLAEQGEAYAQHQQSFVKHFIFGRFLMLITEEEVEKLVPGPPLLLKQIKRRIRDLVQGEQDDPRMNYLNNHLSTARRQLLTSAPIGNYNPLEQSRAAATGAEVPYTMPSSFPMLEAGKEYAEGSDPTGKWRSLKSRLKEVGRINKQPKSLTVASWNVSGGKSNPFEYYAPYGGEGGDELMRSLERVLTDYSEHDVKLAEVFTEEMFVELRMKMRMVGWTSSSIIHAEKLWHEELKHVRMISGFMLGRDELPADGARLRPRMATLRAALLPRADRTTARVNTLDAGTVHRPAVTTCFSDPLVYRSDWWAKWIKFMFDDRMMLSEPYAGSVTLTGDGAAAGVGKGNGSSSEASRTGQGVGLANDSGVNSSSVSGSAKSRSSKARGRRPSVSSRPRVSVCDLLTTPPMPSQQSKQQAPAHRRASISSEMQLTAEETKASMALQVLLLALYDSVMLKLMAVVNSHYAITDTMHSWVGVKHRLIDSSFTGRHHKTAAILETAYRDRNIIFLQQAESIWLATLAAGPVGEKYHILTHHLAAHRDEGGKPGREGAAIFCAILLAKNVFTFGLEAKNDTMLMAVSAAVDQAKEARDEQFMAKAYKGRTAASGGRRKSLTSGVGDEIKDPKHASKIARRLSLAGGVRDITSEVLAVMDSTQLPPAEGKLLVLQVEDAMQRRFILATIDGCGPVDEGIAAGGANAAQVVEVLASISSICSTVYFGHKLLVGVSVSDGAAAIHSSAPEKVDVLSSCFGPWSQIRQDDSNAASNQQDGGTGKTHTVYHSRTFLQSDLGSARAFSERLDGHTCELQDMVLYSGDQMRCTEVSADSSGSGNGNAGGTAQGAVGTTPAETRRKTIRTKVASTTALEEEGGADKDLAGRLPNAFFPSEHAVVAASFALF